MQGQQNIKIWKSAVYIKHGITQAAGEALMPNFHPKTLMFLQWSCNHYKHRLSTVWSTMASLT